MFVKYNKPHIWEIKKVGKFIPNVGNYFIVESECLLCGLMHKEHFVTGETLMEKGYSADKIKALQSVAF